MIFLALLFLFSPIFIFASQNTPNDPHKNQPPYNLWFTGSLLELTPVNLSPGQTAIEPVLVISNTYGKYNSKWEIEHIKTISSINPIMEFKIGLFPKTELKIVASYISKFQGNKVSSHFQDMLFFLGYQLLKDKKHSITPDLSFFLQLTAPTGKFDKLNPQKAEIDASGQGAYQFGPALAYQKIFYLPKNYFILYGNIIYLFNSDVKVKGLNTYGGGYGTKGKIQPGQKLFVIISGEYLFNQHWGFNCDIQLLYQRKTSNFIGKLGVTDKEIPAQVGLPSSSQVSLTPSIEYNFSADLGVFGGCWFTVAGRNSAAFTGGFAALVYAF